MSTDQNQALVDAYYLDNGKKPCCAGCDHWAFINSRMGECTASPPVGAVERAAMLNMKGVSFNVGAGHVLTPYDHQCGSFVDTFEW